MATSKPQKPKPSSLREAFARFFEDPSRDKLHDLIKGSGGEFKDLDFKVEWPAKAAVAKQVLALGNIGGGVLVVGVEEKPDGSLVPMGVDKFTDKATITGWLKGIVPPALLDEVAVHDFDYPSGEYGIIQGMKFQVMFVAPNEDHLPFLPLKEAEKIVPGTIYVRRDGMIDAAGNEEVQRILNARIARGNSTQSELDLKAHFDQLRVLYDEIRPNRPGRNSWLLKSLAGSNWVMALGGTSEPNPLYPTESLDEFVSSQIDAKKHVIKAILGT